MDKNKQKFYIIGIDRTIEGLFAIVNSVICHSLYAKNKNFIPIVDMKNFANQYFKDNCEFKDNVWEYFFEQPDNYSLNDIPVNADITYCEDKLYPHKQFSLVNDDIPINQNKQISKYIEYLKQEYKNNLRFNKETGEYLTIESEKIINDGKNILGVLCRGTDYIKKKPKNEAIMPSPQRVIRMVKKFLTQNKNIQKIYLATEDAQIYDLFKCEFGEMIIDNNQYRYGKEYNDENFLAEVDINLKNHKYNLAKKYLLSVYILSKCQYFIGGRATGTKWAWIWNENWEKFHIWKLGRYKQPFYWFNLFINQIFSLQNKYEFNEKIKILTILGFKINIKKSKML